MSSKRKTSPCPSSTANDIPYCFNARKSGEPAFICRNTNKYYHMGKKNHRLVGGDSIFHSHQPKVESN